MKHASHPRYLETDTLYNILWVFIVITIVLTVWLALSLPCRTDDEKLGGVVWCDMVY